MNTHSLPFLGVQFPLFDLIFEKEEGNWIVLKHPGQEAYLSIQFCTHFFSTPSETESYIQNEIQLVADANDLLQSNGITYLSNNILTATYFQYIDNISHLVHIGARVSPKENGIWYMAVTKDEVMTDNAVKIFQKTNFGAPLTFGERDETQERLLQNHNLKYLSSYRSDWGSGGGTSTEKVFSFYDDNSFKYRFDSVVSFGSLGGNTSHDEGWGYWEIQKNNGEIYLILKWHLKGISNYLLKWNSNGIMMLDKEQYLLD